MLYRAKLLNYFRSRDRGLILSLAGGGIACCTRRFWAARSYSTIFPFCWVACRSSMRTLVPFRFALAAIRHPGVDGNVNSATW